MLELGDIVVAGYRDDADLGRVVAITGDTATVAWEGALVQTPYPTDWPDADSVFACADITSARAELARRAGKE